MNNLQAKVRLFVAEHRLSTSLEVRLLDAVSELGEVAKEALRSTAYGKQPFTRSTAFTDELGDVLFSLLCVANDAGVDVEHAVNQALAKYERRIRRSGTPAAPSEASGQRAHAKPRRRSIRSGRANRRADHSTT